MREFKEKRIYITMEISLSNKNAIEKIIGIKNISFNEFINEAIKNNFKDNLSKINIYKREDAEPVKLRIYESIYIPMCEFTKKYNISITKIITYCIFEEIKKYNMIK
jgi:hypothetical protein